MPKRLDKFLESEFQTEEITEEFPDREEERVMLGLRLCEGIELREEISARLRFIPREYYRISGGRLSLTPKGFLVSNEIIAMLIE